MLVALMAMIGVNAFAQHVLSPEVIIKDGVYYKVVTVYKNQTSTEINTVTVAQSNAYSQASLVIGDQVTLTLNTGKDENGNAIEGDFTFNVIGIEAQAFQNNKTITSVEIGNNVTEIGASAFNGCTKLSTVTFKEGSQLTTIGDFAFGNTASLKELDLSNCEKLAHFTDDGAAKVAGNNYTFPFIPATAETNNYLETLTLSKVVDIHTALAGLTKLSEVNLGSALTAVVASAFDGDVALTELELPATCVSVANGALTGSKVAELTINSNATAGAQAIGTGAAIDANNNITTVTFVGEFKGSVGASAFPGNKLATVAFDAFSGTVGIGAFGVANGALKSLTFGEMKAGATIAAGAFVVGAGAAVEFGTISNAAFNATADIITGNVVAATLTIGDINAAISNRIIVNKVGAVETGAISAAVDVTAFGTASSISFGEIKTGGSVTSTAGAARTSLTSVTFTGAVAAGGVAAGAFVYESKLETVEFKGLLEAGAVVTGSFGDGTDEAGSAVTQTATRTWYLTVIYKPTAYTQAFDADAFWDAAKAPAPDMVKFLSNMTFTGDVRFNAYYGAGAFFNVILSQEGETRNIVVAGPSGASVFYGKFIADGSNYKIAKKQESGATVNVYEAYVDDNGSTSQIVYLPLTAVGNYYVVANAEAVVVRSTTADEVLAEATNDADTHNYDGTFAKKNEIQYYDQGNSFDYMTVSVDAQVVLDDNAGQYVFAMTNPAAGIPSWSRFDASLTLPKYTLYVATPNLNAASAARLEVIWADGINDNEATAIKSVKTAAVNGAIYNLSGQKVNASYKGVVIKDGKKYIQK